MQNSRDTCAIFPTATLWQDMGKKLGWHGRQTFVVAHPVIEGAENDGGEVDGNDEVKAAQRNCHSLWYVADIAQHLTPLY